MAWFDGNRWFEGYWWDGNWYAGQLTPAKGGDGGGEAIAWEIKRRRKKRKQPIQVTIIKLPPLAVLLEALED